MIAYAENYYSFRAIDSAFLNLYTPSSTDTAALAAIEAKLLEANSDFLDRRYADAISAYQMASGLIYAQLAPDFPIGLSRVATLPHDVSLFDPLLSASLEWMNVIPIHLPVSPARSRIPYEAKPADPRLNATGLGSARLAKPASLNAAADVQLVKTFQRQGNAAAAAFFLQRARASDQEVANLLLRDGKTEDGIDAGRSEGGAAVPQARAAPVAPQSVSSPLVQTVGSGQPLPIERDTLPVSVGGARRYDLLVGKLAQTGWQVGSGPPLAELKAAFYQQRVATTNLADVIWQPAQPADVALTLAHDYYYVIPLGLAECYHALGDYAKAEALYFQAAAYQYLNPTIEAPYIWMRLASLYLDWGNSLYRQDDTAQALSVYQHVLMADSSVPASALYTTAALAPGANAARAVVAALPNMGAVAAVAANPLLKATILDVYQQLVKIGAGLDYWGYSLTAIPIWTFDYVQSVATTFAQYATTAERDVINYWSRADLAALTRQQLVQGVAQAQAEVQVASLQAAAAQAEVGAYRAAVTLATTRATDAHSQASEYANLSDLWIQYQAESAQVSGGDDGDPDRLNQLADQLQAGQSISDSRGTVSAAVQLAGSRYNRQYEIDSLDRQANELDLARTQAQAELAAAQARSVAASAEVTAATVRATGAQDSLMAFDAQFFTPDVWHRLGDALYQLYQRYLHMAIRTARLMQLAYNFEYDQDVRLIRGDYAASEVKGLLGADALLADIQSFTFDLVTSQTAKPQPVRQTISLANQYPFLFEKQLRKTGAMEFQTRIEDFDDVYPGTYAGRIEAVEVEVDGIVPAAGITGTLSNGGVSWYRTPASEWTDPETSGLKRRVQPSETLVISDYRARNDTLLVQPDQRQLRIFEGAGVASTWRLELPREINDIDYGALLDVRLIFYYRARYDPDLAARVKVRLAGLTGFTTRQMGLPLRWLYPDAFFHFQDTGRLDFTLAAADFPGNQTRPILTDVGILVATDGTIAPGGLVVSLATPTHAAVAGTTDASGAITSGGASSWTPLAAGTAIGGYSLTLTAADNQALVHDGKLVLAPIINLVLILGYTFTPKT